VGVPNSADLLELWEQTGGLTHPERAVQYARVADPSSSASDVRELSIGRRDAAILRLRSATFGRRLAATARCPSCDETMEFEIDVSALIPTATETARTIEIAYGGRRVACRIPTTSDLLEVLASGGGPGELASRCVDGLADVPPEALVELLGERLADADPAADIRLDLRCPSCGFDWPAPFDIVTVVDLELDTWARSTLRDVATLAHAYGWNESEVLALSAARRRHYLELAAT